MDNRFLERAEELTKKVSDIEITKKVAMQQIKSTTEQIRETLKELNGLDVPVINGEKAVNLNIDEDRLGQFPYVNQVTNMIPDVLAHIERVGVELIDKAIVQA